MDAAIDKARYAELKLNLKLVCDKCQRSGLVPWEQLDRIVLCRNCDTWYRVERGGIVEVPPPQAARVAVQVRSSSSEWRGHEALIPAGLSLPFAARLRVWLMDFITRGPARWAAACGLAVMIAGGMALAARGNSPPAATVLPDTLDERAVVCTLAIARRDQDVLVRLTEPGAQRRLRSWLAHECPVQQVADDQAGALGASVLQSAAQDSAGRDHTLVRVRLASTAGAETVLSEQWVEREGTWYFQPPAAPRATAAPRGKQPGLKPARRAR